MSRRGVRRARAIIQREVRRDGRCPNAHRILHTWTFDGYFWHHCAKCGRVS